MKIAGDIMRPAGDTPLARRNRHDAGERFL